MKFLEKDLEEIIFESDRDALADRGLYIAGKLHRQLRIGNYGVADLVSFDPPRRIDNNEWFEPALITVYELKKDKIGISAFLQAVGYAKGIERYMQLRDVSFEYNVNIVLIGSEIDTNSTFSYLPDMLPSIEFREYVELYSYSYGVDGIIFTEHNNYKLKNEGFNIKNSPF